MAISKREVLRRQRISRALKQRAAKERRRRERIRESLRLYRETGLTKKERDILAPVLWPEAPEKAWEKPKGWKPPEEEPTFEKPPEKPPEKPSELPEGFKPLVTPGTIKERIEDNLHFIRSQLPQWDPRVDVVENADGSVDGEMRLRGWRSWGEVREATIQVEGMIVEIPGVWISVGSRFSGPSELADPEHGAYDRYRGLYQVMAYSQKTTKKSLNFVTARQMISTLHKRGKRMPEEIVIRLSWKPGGERPK